MAAKKEPRNVAPPLNNVVSLIDLRGMIQAALSDMGGVDYLKRQAEENPAIFLALVGKCLTKEIKANVSASHSIQRLSPDQVSGLLEVFKG